METYENVFLSILPKEEAEKAKAISDIMMDTEDKLLAEGADPVAVKEMMRQTRLSSLIGKSS